MNTRSVLNQTKMKKNSPSVHHIIPRSKGGSDDQINLAEISQRKHALYHQLFENRTPEEIIKYLVEYFWLSQNKIDGIRFVIRFKEARTVDEFNSKIFYDGTTWRRTP